MHDNERRDAPADQAAGDEPAILDLEKALNRLDNDRSLFNEMAEYFLADSRRLLYGIRSGIAARQAEEPVRGAHTLKNLAATCGGDRAAHAAERVEQLGIAEAWDALPAAVARLESEVAALAERLRGIAWEF